jgi:hypothetical protein
MSLESTVLVEYTADVLRKHIAELEAENAELKQQLAEAHKAGMLEAAAIVEPYIGEWEVSLRTIVEKIREAADIEI